MDGIVSKQNPQSKGRLKKIPLNFRVSVELQKMEAVDKLLNVISSQPW